ncbi:hypothetical protein QJS10_CPB12g00961 [Acorus calamus]|uniref:Uncharacterized protein n=1 Tax=Acorus calamus TaxID=4465 RepID=A0AAV9DL78_ACOCL|nr:hypothetical protein QJS10_CPB12g00961 [Acorus calamus]
MVAMKRFLPYLLLLLFLLHSSEAVDDKLEPSYPIHKQMNARKLIVTTDYDYGGANQRHDPHKGRPGGGKP